MGHGTIQPLSTIPPGRAVTLRRIDSGHGLESRLAAMGLLPGASVYVYRNDAGGPIVLGVHGGRVVLGRGMTERVLVEEDAEAT